MFQHPVQVRDSEPATSGRLVSSPPRPCERPLCGFSLLDEPGENLPFDLGFLPGCHEEVSLAELTAQLSEPLELIWPLDFLSHRAATESLGKVEDRLRECVE